MEVVTGSCGYIGKYITRKLISSGKQVKTITTHPDKPNPFGRDVKAYPHNFNNPELLNPDSLEMARKGCGKFKRLRFSREELRLARDAFTVLIDPERRAVYDVTCQGWSAPVRASYRA